MVSHLLVQGVVDSVLGGQCCLCEIDPTVFSKCSSVPDGAPASLTEVLRHRIENRIPLEQCAMDDADQPVINLADRRVAVLSWTISRCRLAEIPIHLLQPLSVFFGRSRVEMLQLR